jgi:hypothetical protein
VQGVVSRHWGAGKVNAKPVDSNLALKLCGSKAKGCAAHPANQGHNDGDLITP